MPRIVVVVADGYLDSALAVTLDVLDAANRVCDHLERKRPFRLEVRAPSTAAVRTGTGYNLEVDGALSNRLRPDVVIAIGLNRPMPEQVDAMLASEDGRRIVDFLRRQGRRGALICACCSSTFLAAEAGLLKNNAATTSWWLAPHFRARYPRIALHAEQTLTINPSVVCAGAALSQFDLALWLVRRHAGAEVAEIVARYLVLDERSTQSRYALTEHLRGASPEVVSAERFIRSHLDGPLSVPAIARAVGVSERTFARRVQQALGISPIRLIQRLRAEKAVHLLQTTRMNVEQVAERVGYQDATTLRRVLRRESGLSPRALASRS